VLLLPRRAIRSAAGRQYVEYLDQGNRQVAHVTLGITAAGDAEILSGLDEGQLVLVDP
jgi:hypothetical protein